MIPRRQRRKPFCAFAGPITKTSARAHYEDVKSGIADVRSADADLRAEANAATFTVTKFFTRLKNTAGRDDEGEIFVFLAMHAHQRPRVFVRTAGMCLCPVASLQVCLF